MHLIRTFIPAGAVLASITTVVGWNGYDRERADALSGRRVFPIFPDPGDAERIAVPPEDGVPLPLSSF